MALSTARTRSHLVPGILCNYSSKQRSYTIKKRLSLHKHPVPSSDGGPLIKSSILPSPKCSQYPKASVCTTVNLNSSVLTEVFPEGLDGKIKYKYEDDNEKTRPFSQDALNWTEELSETAFIDPFKELQSNVVTELLSKEEALLDPTPEVIKQGETMFQTATFIKSVASLDQLPRDDVPEIAVFGQPQVGKRSLIQALFSNSPDILQTLNEQGNPQLLNVFDVGGMFRIVDVPGLSDNTPEKCKELVKGYLSKRKNICQTLYLMSGPKEQNKIDDIGLSMMNEFGIPHVILLTEIDLFSPHVLLKMYLEIRKKWILPKSNCCPQVFLVSSKTGAGVQAIQAFVAYITGNLKKF